MLNGGATGFSAVEHLALARRKNRALARWLAGQKLPALAAAAQG